MRTPQTKVKWNQGWKHTFDLSGATDFKVAFGGPRIIDYAVIIGL